MSSHLRLLVGALLALLGLVPAVPATAQPGEPTALRVLVRGAPDGAPLRHAQVLVVGTGVGGVTRADGTVLLAPVSAGPVRVRVQLLGYATAEETVTLDGGRTGELRVALSPRPLRLAEVRATVRGRRGPKMLTDRGFYLRRSSGIGSFYTRDDIVARRPAQMSDFLRSVPGIGLTALPGTRARASMDRATGGRNCPIQYFIDGVLTAGFNIDDIPPNDIEGIEIYRGASQIPSEFNRRTASCGVIVVWTRID